ncbi:MAG: hydantoinase/oxoprolinase family protein [Haloferacaceae archaeon]
MTVRIGIDTGGTFTDVVRYDADAGTVTVTKTPSTPASFDEGVLTGLDEVLDATGTDPADVGFLSHGTTVGTNAVLEGEMPDLGLITNAGLEDVLAIGDQTRPELYDLQAEKPPVLIPRRRRLGVDGRLDYAGEEVDPLDEAGAREAARELADDGVESVVVATLFSHLNDDHERRIAAAVESETDLDCALSSAVYPEPREYDRTVTTVLNEAVKVTIRDYLDRLTAGLDERGVAAPLTVMHSGGGVFGTDEAVRSALRTVLSGPAAGAVAARDAAGSEDRPNAIGLDMGGTSADVSIVEGGDLVRTTEGEIADLPVKVPLIDVNTVGAGGGSVAWVDDAGGLRVGPRSAGADPGPVCYGRGGTEPTVTDANLALGRVDPGDFIDDPAPEAAHAAVREELAEPLGVTPEEAALSVLGVANARMAREIRRVTVERGRDPSEFALVAFGGAGPMQAAAIARAMDIESVLIPRSPGVFSARGLLVADVRMDESRAYPGTEPDAETGAAVLGDLRERLLDRFREQGFAPDAVDVAVTVDARYRGQSYEVSVPLAAGEFTPDAVAATVERFHDEHARRYGHAMRDEPVEFVTLRAAGTVPTDPVEVDVGGGADAGAARTGRRDVYFADAGYVETDVYDRESLAPGATVDGPAILEEPSSTAVVPPDATATVTDRGNVEVRVGSGR